MNEEESVDEFIKNNNFPSHSVENCKIDECSKENEKSQSLLFKGFADINPKATLNLSKRIADKSGICEGKTTYECCKCNYKTKRKYDYNCHLKTKNLGTPCNSCS